MTAEVAILNKKAVAIAADSAITIQGESGPKIFTSANKIFQLSKYHPVGIMVYQNSQFMGIPWETIIKIYRNQINKKSFKNLYNYADDFLNFLRNNEFLFKENQKIDYLKQTIYQSYNKILSDISDDLDEMIKSRREKDFEITKENFNSILNKILDEVIDTHYKLWKEATEIEQIKQNPDILDQIKNNYKEIIVELKNETFSSFKLTNVQSRKLTDIAFSTLTKFPERTVEYDFGFNYSGLVFVGYGEQEIFPAIKTYRVEGIILNMLKCREESKHKISFESSAAIFPFAQHEMVYSFMEGIDPAYQSWIINNFLGFIIEYPKIILNVIDELNSSQKQKYLKKIQRVASEEARDRISKITDYSTEHFVQPIIDTVETLPKPELASMAESLVNLTNLRRKISLKAETVGGPIDVAVISKGDGFIWIKRKHYFKSELNHHFFDTYYKEGAQDETKESNERNI